MHRAADVELDREVGELLRREEKLIGAMRQVLICNCSLFAISYLISDLWFLWAVIGCLLLNNITPYRCPSLPPSRARAHTHTHTHTHTLTHTLTLTHSFAVVRKTLTQTHTHTHTCAYTDTDADTDIDTDTDTDNDNDTHTYILSSAHSFIQLLSRTEKQS